MPRLSEYQYYEFQAIDRPLDRAAQQALRLISSRARITAMSFTNHYEWGDFKGDPRKFMERWFDVHVYLANWGTRRLMIRVPKHLLARREIDPFLRKIDWVKVWTSGDNLIIDIDRTHTRHREGHYGCQSRWRARCAEGLFGWYSVIVSRGDVRFYVRGNSWPVQKSCFVGKAVADGPG